MLRPLAWFFSASRIFAYHAAIAIQLAANRTISSPACARQSPIDAGTSGTGADIANF
jgi:hypothetical protein